MAIEIIPDKICPKCEGNVWYILNVEKHWYSCDVCRKKQCEQWNIDNPDKQRLRSIRYYQNNKTAVDKRTKDYYLKHPDKRSKLFSNWLNKDGNKERFQKIRQQKSIVHSQTLSDIYVKSAIVKGYFNDFGEKILQKDIPNEIVEDYRRVMRNKRINNEFLILSEMETQEQVKSRKEELAILKALSPEEKKEKARIKVCEYQKNRYYKLKKQREEQILTTESLTQLVEASVVKTGVYIKNPEYIRKAQVAKANKEVRIAAKASLISTPAIVTSPAGSLESLLNNLNNLKNKKQEILNHLEVIKQLINQF